MKKANAALRRCLYAARIPLWELAAAVGVHESTVIRWLRTPLTPERKEAIERAIQKILEEREG